MQATRKDFLKLLGLGAGAAMAPGLVWAQSGGRRLRVANFYPTDHSMNRALREVFVAKLPEYTNNALSASLHDNSSLGAERELTEGVRLGTIEMGITGGLVSASVPIFAALELPYVFKDFDHAWRVFDGPIGQELKTEFDKIGLKALAWVGNGFRAISNSVRPLNSLADMQGLRLRMPENRVYIETGRALGFNVITMPFSEIFNALSQRVVDAQDNPPPTVLASKWYEVQAHLAITNHIFSYGTITINKNLWDRLPAEQQEGLQRAADETAVLQRRLLAEDSAQVVSQLESAGMQITRPNISELQAATQKVREEIGSSITGGKALLDRIAAA